MREVNLKKSRKSISFLLVLIFLATTILTFEVIPPKPVQAASLLGSWVSGLTHEKEAGKNRLLVFYVYAISSNAVSASTVTYGGKSMTLIKSASVGSSSQYSYVAAFYLNEANIAAATSSTFEVTWSGTPSSTKFGSVFATGINQTTPIGASTSQTDTSSIIDMATGGISMSRYRDLFFMGATRYCTGYFTPSNSFNEIYDDSASLFSSVAGCKVADYLSDFSYAMHSITTTSPFALIGFVVQAAAPQILSATLNSACTYMDVVISSPVFTNTGGAGALVPADFTLTFTRNSGNATAATIASLTKTDGVSTLVGGESTIRVNLNITGTPSGVETIELKPATTTSIYDYSGAAMAATETSGVKYLLPSYFGYWKFDNNTADYSNLNHLNNSGCTFSNNSIVGPYALSLDGSSNYAYTSSLVNLVNLFSIAGWVYIPTGRTGTQTIIANASSGVTSGFKLFINSDNTTDKKIIFETSNGVTSLSASTPSNTFAYDGWHHIAATINKITGVTELYYDGIKSTSGSTISTSFNSNAVINVGRMPGGSRYMGGKIDDLRIYSRILSATEITALTTKPQITGATLQTLNSYIDISLNQRAYTGSDGTGALTPSDFQLIFSNNGGTATGASISSVSNTNGVALSGGETAVRINLNITGVISGLETIEIKPTNSTSIYNSSSLAMDASQSSGIKTLAPVSSVTFLNQTLALDNSYIDVTFNQAVYTAENKTGGLTASDFAVVFSSNSETLTNIAIDHVTNTDDSPLTGGESSCRIYLTLTGSVLGVEFFQIKPATGSSIYDAYSIAMNASKITSVVSLYSNNITAWKCSRKIYIDTTPSGSNISETLTNFPVLVRLNTSNFDYSQAASDGADIRFTDPSGSAKYYYEIETWNSSGESTIWVNVPTIVGNSAEQYMNMYWGNSAAVRESNGSIVFHRAFGSYLSVWHLNNTNYKDSTYGSSLTAGASVSNVPGLISNAASFPGTGTTSYLNAGYSNNYISNMSMTFSCWVNHSGNITGKQRLFSSYITSKGKTSTVFSPYFQATNSLGFEAANSTLVAQTFNYGGTYASNAWYYITITFDGKTFRKYINGALDGGSTAGTLANAGSATAYIGSNMSKGELYAGLLDEMRFTYAVSSEDRIKMEYENQKPGSTTLKYGPFVKNVTSSTADGTYKRGDVVNVSVQFNEPVTVDTTNGTPKLTLETGVANHDAFYQSGSGTNTLTFRYLVNADDYTSDLNYVSASNSLSLNGGTIKSSDNQTDASLKLPIPGSIASLGYNKNIVLIQSQGSGPSINYASISFDSVYYVDIEFSEPVYSNISGTNPLSLANFDIIFNQNGGNITSVTKSSITKNNGSPLSGGETCVRIGLTVTGTPSNVETIEIKQPTDILIYSVSGTPMSVDETTGLLYLRYMENWKYNTILTLDTSASGANISETVSNFPVLVRLNAANFDFLNAGINGEDIRFTSSDGEFLKYEIENWDNTAREAAIWVQVPTILGNNASQYINMYWGCSTATSLSDSMTVFTADNGFNSVLHFVDFKDATSHAYDGTTTGTVITQSSIIGSGANFDGSDDTVNIGDSSRYISSSTQPFTVSGWVNADTINSSPSRIFTNYSNSSTINMSLYLQSNHLVFDANKSLTSTTTLSSGIWYYVTLTYDGDDFRMYVDGTAEGTPVASTSNAGSVDVSSFIGSTKYNTNYFDGLMDELRTSTVSRSADWIKLEYENQKVPQTLVRFVGKQFGAQKAETRTYNASNPKSYYYQFGDIVPITIQFKVLENIKNFVIELNLNMLESTFANSGFKLKPIVSSTGILDSSKFKLYKNIANNTNSISNTVHTMKNGANCDATSLDLDTIQLLLDDDQIFAAGDLIILNFDMKITANAARIDSNNLESSEDLFLTYRITEWVYNNLKIADPFYIQRGYLDTAEANKMKVKIRVIDPVSLE